MVEAGLKPLEAHAKREETQDPAYYRGYLTLLRCERMGAVRLRRLLERFGSPEAVLRASRQDLLSVQGMTERVADSILHAAKGSFDRKVEKEISWLREKRVKLLLLGDPSYPRLLREISSPPVVLYVWGEYRPEDMLAIGIVGSRHASDYGRRCASQLACSLAERGLTIVSGLAAGIDTSAHKGALRTGGRTVAVMGSGLKICYPRHNEELACQIRKSGALLSELPFDEPPLGRNFPPRNRLIAGLSLGVVIVEAAEKSGALHTARFALDQNRDVFAVPGMIGAQTSRGTNALIRDSGAKLVTCPEDILSEIEERIEAYRRELDMPTLESPGPAVRVPPPPPSDLSPLERSVLEAITGEPIHIDDLSRRLSLPSGQLFSLLGMLELRGLVERAPGTRFRRPL